MKRGVSLLALGAAAGIAWAAFGQAPSPPDRGPSKDPYYQLHLFGEVFEAVRDKYVEKPDEARLIAAAIRGMLASLDPHSAYIDGKAYRAMQALTSGEFGEVGIDVTQKEGAVTVDRTTAGLSAANAGVLAGDVIAAVDGQPIRGLTLDQAAEKLRGPVYSTVRLTILRGAAKETREFRVERDVVKIQSVRWRIESGDIGYIRITQFTDATARGLRRVMAALRAAMPPEKLKGYILDLRNNPGGFVDQSIQVVNVFVDKGEIVETRGRNPQDERRFDAEPGEDLSGGKPLVVLINGGSASASEIVAGALQDLKRATLIGTRSFGKGSMQTTISLGEGRALWLTTARYYTPSGRSIQASGVEPDFEIAEDVPDALKGQFEKKGEASLKRHLPAGDEIETSLQTYVPPDPKDDKQLIAAAARLHGQGRAPAAPADPTSRR